MIVYAAESLYWFNTTEPPYLIKGGFQHRSSHVTQQGVEWNWGDPGCEGLLGVCDTSMVD